MNALLSFVSVFSGLPYVLASALTYFATYPAGREPKLATVILSFLVWLFGWSLPL